MEKIKKIWITSHCCDNNNNLLIGTITFENINIKHTTVQEFNQSYLMFKREELLLLKDRLVELFEKS